MKNNSRGEVVTIVVVILAALGATQLVPNWRITHLFSKGPPTQELRVAQEDAAKAKAEVAAAQARLEAALLEQKTRTVDQARYSQQMISGVPMALARAPQTPEVIFASGLAKRAYTGLASAIGDLPADKQAEIAFLVEQALSAKQAEVDAAKLALAVKDKELQDTTTAKLAVEAKLPVLDQQAKAAEARAVSADAVVVVKTNQVATYAEKAAEKEKEAGSFQAFAHKLLWVLGLSGAGYVLIHFVLPSLAQEFPGAQRLVNFNKAAKSIFSAHT